MELWVRSQDKCTLAKVKEFHIGNFNNILVREDEDDLWTILGEYDSKQRCLEILDEIQKLICDSDKTLLTTTSFLDKETYDEILKEIAQNKFNVISCENAQLFQLNQTVVYQMPEK